VRGCGTPNTLPPPCTSYFQFGVHFERSLFLGSFSVFEQVQDIFDTVATSCSRNLLTQFDVPGEARSSAVKRGPVTG